MGCELAILKEFSPSCGVRFVYDGTHTGNKIQGQGVTTKLLRDHGIIVYSDRKIDRFITGQL